MFLNKRVIAYRIFGRRGNYPQFSLFSSRHIFFSSSSIVWSAVLQDPLPEDWEKAEVYTLLPEEIRLLSAILLSEKDTFTRGSLGFELWSKRWVAVEDPPDMRTKAFRTISRRVLEQLVAEARADSWLPAQREGDYTVQETGYLLDAQAYLQAFEVTDQLLLAGHSRLLSGIRLRCAGEFLEEAFVQLTISMEAALSFLRLHLEMTEERASVQRVYDYLRSVFPFGDSLVEFLEGIYELRIIAVHPISRFGEAWISPTMVGTVYELERWLKLIYRHIVLGEVPAASVE